MSIPPSVYTDLSIQNNHYVGNAVTWTSGTLYSSTPAFVPKPVALGNNGVVGTFPSIVTSIAAGTGIGVTGGGVGAVTISATGVPAANQLMILSTGSSTQALTAGGPTAISFGTVVSNSFTGGTFTNHTTFFTNSDSVSHTYLVSFGGRFNGASGSGGGWIEGGTTAGASSILGGFTSGNDTANILNGIGVTGTGAITLAAGSSFNITAWSFAGYTSIFGASAPWNLSILLLS